MISDNELLRLWQQVCTQARNNLSSEQLEESRKHFESYRLTGYEHNGAWRKRG